MYNFLVILAKLASYSIKVLGLGAGFTWPGHIGLKLKPNLLANDKIVFKKGVILISGTNGKTTTSKLVTHLLESNGFSVVHNTSGANLVNGLATIILLKSKLFRGLVADIGVFEVDEFALPHVLKYLKPRCLVLLNLSRDQLDRYGETDIIFERWLEEIKNLDKETTVFFDSDQQEFSAFSSLDNASYKKFIANEAYLALTQLRGSFNAKNVSVAAMVAEAFGLTSQQIMDSLKKFKQAYGRGEVAEYSVNGEKALYHVYLAKNPASFNHNIELMADFTPESTALFFILNDNIPDGRDVSWIYDIEAEKLYEYAKRFNKIYVSGTRCLDMVVRLQYAGLKVDKQNVSPNLGHVANMITKDPEIKDVLAFPNYSAMLELREHIVGRKIL